MSRFLVRAFGILLTIVLAATAFAGTAAAGATTAKCAAYKSGSMGAGKPLAVVTDKATSKKPLSVKVSTGPGLGLTSTTPDAGPGSGDTGSVTHNDVNVQVNTATRSTGLYIRVEFAPYEDYDLYLRDKTGSAVAYVGGFNVIPVPGTFLDGTGNGGHSEMGAEQIDGYPVKNCAGFTVDIVSATTPGGPVTVKYWLGKPS